MTELENRVSKLEDKYHSVDTRQQTFEEFTRENLKYIKEAVVSTNERMNRMESKLDNLLIGGGIGVAAILATMIGIVVALK